MFIKAIKALSLLFVFTFIAVSVNAQSEIVKGQKRSPEEIAKMRTDKMRTNLQLDDSQYEKVYAMNLQEAKSRVERRERMKGEMKQKMKAHDEQLKLILSPEQYQKQKQSENKARQRMKERAQSKKEGNMNNNNRPATNSGTIEPQPIPQSDK